MANGNFTQWSEKLKDAIILNGIYAYMRSSIVIWSRDKGTQQCFKDLKTQAQWEGPIKQIALLQEALSTYCSQSKSLPVMVSQITNIVKRTFNIDEINADLFTCIALLSSLNDLAFKALQNSVSTLLSKSTKKLLCKLMDI
ncbi:hypothetical protein C0995_005030 [Termitomyces sp. Mi166|nr:hypothetical protein C0995_005030 [Termitomyces sp. Mi166\